VLWAAGDGDGYNGHKILTDGTHLVCAALRLRSIHEASVRNLGRAIREFDLLRVYDNSAWGAEPSLLLETQRGRVVFCRESLPTWLVETLVGPP
jgi:predicted ABC-type ATPase